MKKIVCVMAVLLVNVQLSAHDHSGEQRGTSKISVNLTPLAGVGRSFGPMPVEIHMRSNSAPVISGHLHMEFLNGGGAIASMRTRQLVMSNTDQRVRIILPPMDRSIGSAPGVRVRMKFETDEQEYPLHDQFLLPISKYQRNMVVGYVRSSNITALDDGRIMRGLSLSSWHPVGRVEQALTDSLHVIHPYELPKKPLEYCSYDLLVFNRESFRKAQFAQLEAVAKWVRAGGSVCVFVGDGCEDRHSCFLSDLTREDFILIDGKMAADEYPHGMAWSRAGLGRAVVVLGDPNEVVDPKSEAWRNTVAFLWKFNRDQSRRFTRTGKWTEPGVPIDYGTGTGLPRDWMDYLKNQRLSYETSDVADASILTTVLMPQTVHVAPIGFVIVILLVFVVVVGPADYFLLGAMRRRKLTWIVFPCAAFAFTGFAVNLSRQSMSEADERRYLDIVDLEPALPGDDAAPKVVRRTRFELMLPGTPGRAKDDYKDAIVVSMDNTGSRMSFDGSIPKSFTTRRDVRQWTPYLRRVTTIEDGPPGIDVDWNKCRTENMFQYFNHQSLGKEFMPDRNFTGAIFVLHQHEWFNLDGNPNPLLLHRPVAEKIENPQKNRAYLFLRRICVKPFNTMFELVSQISTTGSENLEDLPLLDPSDPGQRLLVIVEANGENLTVYRRLHYSRKL